MVLGIGKRKQDNYDLIILMNDREIRTIPVESEDEEAVTGAGMVLPKADAEVRYFPGGGRAYVYGYKGNYLAESENIARLEKSVVLRNLFDYGSTARTANIQFYVMIAALIITVFLLRH
ncbi:hypothetical protein [Moorella sp. ACPs]|uniref:hypothetical protein n=1 Tax=Neomoorella carbonis TaxID=3062783 RepID=UPI00324CD2DC